MDGVDGLELHPEKTRLVPFRRPPKHPGSKDGGGNPGSFDFLGFTHLWAISHKGNWAIKRKTAKGRFARAVKAIFAWRRENRDDTWKEQQEALKLKLRGHYQF